MVLLPDEQGFKVGLAGYIAGKPTFRFITRTYGDLNIGCILDYPIKYYLSGEESRSRPPMPASMPKAHHATADTRDQAKLTGIVGDCIEQYSTVLDGPVETLRLIKP
jgi:hypothetical protein